MNHGGKKKNKNKYIITLLSVILSFFFFFLVLSFFFERLQHIQPIGNSTDYKMDACWLTHWDNQYLTMIDDLFSFHSFDFFSRLLKIKTFLLPFSIWIFYLLNFYLTLDKKKRNRLGVTNVFSLTSTCYVFNNKRSSFCGGYRNRLDTEWATKIDSGYSPASLPLPSYLWL